MITWPQTFALGAIGLLISSCSPQVSDTEKNLENHSQAPVHATSPVRASLELSAGIRPDVREWIESRPYENYQNAELLKRALIELAERYQREMASADQLSASRQASREVIAATDCLYSLIGPEVGAQLRDRLQQRTYNTAARKELRQRALQNFEGESIPTLSDDIDPSQICHWMD